MTGIWFSFSEPVQFSNSEILSIWFAMFFYFTDPTFLSASWGTSADAFKPASTHETILQKCGEARAATLLRNDLEWFGFLHRLHTRSLSVSLCCWCGCLCSESDPLMAVCVEMDSSGTSNQRTAWMTGLLM